MTMLRLSFVFPLILHACAGDETTSGYADPTAVYALESVDGVSFSGRATIRFPEEGRIAGEAPCNNYSGDQPSPYPWFEARQIAMTKRACADLEAEKSFFKSLGEMTLVEVSGPALILTNEAGGEMVFRLQE